MVVLYFLIQGLTVLCKLASQTPGPKQTSCFISQVVDILSVFASVRNATQTKQLEKGVPQLLSPQPRFFKILVLSGLGPLSGKDVLGPETHKNSGCPGMGCFFFLGSL